MTMEIFFEGDSVEIISDTDFDDLENASLIEFIVTKPSGEVAKWPAMQVGSTQDITYTTASGDLDEIGTYRIQAHAKWNTGINEPHG